MGDGHGISHSLSIRNKLILSVALVHLVLMGIFVADILSRQRDFVVQETRRQAVNFAGLMAENVLSWVLAEDLMGMDEVLQAGARMMHADYACVTDPAGHVLAHTDKEKVGSFLSDAEALELLGGGRMEPHIWRDDPAFIHAAAPLSMGRTPVGWVLVGMDMDGVSAHLRQIRGTGLLYTAAAIVAGALAAWLLSLVIFRQLEHIMRGIGRLRNNDFSSPVPVLSGDELGHMADALNQASDFLRSSRSELRREMMEHLQAEKQIRHLTGRLVDGNEEERKRLGHDLHDAFGQSVTGMLFGLHSLKAALRPEDAEAHALCEQMIGEAKRFGDDIRRTAYGQYPVVLERLGLAAEASAFLTEIVERHSYLDMAFEVDLPDERLHPRVEVACYRILQEGMANVLRHSGATRVRVQLSTVREWLFLRMEDNGHGFDAEGMLEDTQYDGIGLPGMRARVLAMDGMLEVDSRPGAGCILDAFLPLRFRDAPGAAPGKEEA